MKRAIIVHCWGGYPDYCWYPWAKKELERPGFEVQVPAMPNTDEPTQAEWVPFMADLIKEPDEGLYLIGHSVGCITIMRYLETLTDDQKMGGVVFVAGFVDDLGYDELKNYFTEPIDFNKIKARSKSFSFIHSDNDSYVNLSHGDVLKEKLGGNLIIKEKMGHFSGEVDDDASCTKLPEIVAEIEKMLQNR